MFPTNKTTTKNPSQSQYTPNYVLSYSENTIKYVWHNLLIIKYDYAEQINPFGISPDNFKGTVFEQIDCEIIHYTHWRCALPPLLDHFSLCGICLFKPSARQDNLL
jgi:hypothetical protein